MAGGQRRQSTNRPPSWRNFLILQERPFDRRSGAHVSAASTGRRLRENDGARPARDRWRHAHSLTSRNSPMHGNGRRACDRFPNFSPPGPPFCRNVTAPKVIPLRRRFPIRVDRSTGVKRGAPAPRTRSERAVNFSRRRTTHAMTCPSCYWQHTNMETALVCYRKSNPIPTADRPPGDGLNTERIQPPENCAPRCR